MAVRFARVRVPGDGDCFFHALAFCLGKAQTDPRAMRAALARYQLSQLRRARGAHHRHQLARSIQRLHDGAWAEHEEVAAAARLYARHIRVYEGVNRMWISFGDEARHPTVYMLNERNVHFEPLVRKKVMQSVTSYGERASATA